MGLVNRERKPVRGAGGGLWSMVFELHSCPASAAVPGKVGLEEFDLSHAARVAGSTGQTSAGGSVSLAMVLCGERAEAGRITESLKGTVSNSCK